jgi:hypothetical protein
MIKVTFTLRNLTDAFYDGNDSGTIVGLLNKDHRAKFDYLNKQANGGDLRDNIKQKIGSGQFRDKVELNQLWRKENVTIAFELGARKGYKLATFYIGD